MTKEDIETKLAELREMIAENEYDIQDMYSQINALEYENEDIEAEIEDLEFDLEHWEDIEDGTDPGEDCYGRP